MAKEFESDFYTELQSQVVKIEPEKKKSGSKLEELVERSEQLIKEIKEKEANVVVDPKDVKKLKKELRAVEKAIEEGNLEVTEEIEQEVENEEKTKESEEQEVEEKNKEQEENTEENTKKQDEENVVKEELNEKEEENRDDIVKEQYHEALIALYEHRINSVEIAKKQGSLLVSDEAFKRELILEKEMYRLRNNYMNLGYEDPFKEERTKLIEKEKKAKEPIELEFREKARKFREYEIELARINKSEQEIQEELLDRNISSEKISELNARLDELGAKRRDLELEITKVRSDLEPAVEKRIERTIKRHDLENNYYATLTNEEKASYRYQNARVEKMHNNIEMAQKQEYRNIKLRIEEREHNIKMIKYELEKTSKVDFERRIELLDNLDKEAAMLAADRESKYEIDTGVRLTETERKQDIIADYEIEQERKEDFAKETEEAQIIVEKQEEKKGEQVVKEPIQVQLEDKTRESNVEAVTFAVLADNPNKEEPDTIVDDTKQFVGAKLFIEALQDEVRDPDNLEDAKAILESEEKIEKEKIEKANQELERKEEELEKRT